MLSGKGHTRGQHITRGHCRGMRRRDTAGHAPKIPTITGRNIPRCGRRWPRGRLLVGRQSRELQKLQDKGGLGQPYGRVQAGWMRTAARVLAPDGAEHLAHLERLHGAHRNCVLIVPNSAWMGERTEKWWWFASTLLVPARQHNKVVDRPSPSGGWDPSSRLRRGWSERASPEQASRVWLCVRQGTGEPVQSVRRAKATVRSRWEAFCFWQD